MHLGIETPFFFKQQQQQQQQMGALKNLRSKQSFRSQPHIYSRT